MSSPISTAAARIAIVGRPNVGKSTLFNRLVGYRRAITDATPGVTRDSIEEKWELARREVRLIDTGGYTNSDSGFDPLVSAEALARARTADLCLFLVDVGGLTAEDEEMLELLRGLSERLVLVVNKVDNSKRELALWDFHRLGIPDLVGVSAEHGIGIPDLEELVEKKLSKLPPNPEAQPAAAEAGQTDIVHIAVLGKPNTGKSTYVNALLGSDASIVSDIPGTTRDVLERELVYAGRRYRILDTAGIRRKNRVEENLEYYSVTRAIDAIEKADVVFLMIDASDGLSDQDKKIAGLIVERGRGVVLCLNKWDLLEDIPNRFNAERDRLRYMFPVLSFAPIVAMSAAFRTDIFQPLKTAAMVNRELERRIDTGKLNRRLERWVEETPPPAGPKGRYKLLYMTQVSTKPLRFVLFVNRRKGFPDSYLAYLRNRLRRELGFSHVPLFLDLRERS
jgi:GTP-binding protein